MALIGRNAQSTSRNSSKDQSEMAKETNGSQTPRDGVISIIGPGMRVDGDCTADGTLRVEGYIKGTVRAGKAVVVSKDGVVEGDILTQDAIIGGKVTGTVSAESRLELQATCQIQGEIRARRIKLDEGGQVNGNVRTGDAERPSSVPAAVRTGGGETAAPKSSGPAIEATPGM
ncbi:MAG TPA: polymer-forming cytoskeletal protein [Longimicrobiales bacterium]|nr:polymer-forming cytoskeletal protein [Longimicrobiales bacterium]